MNPTQILSLFEVCVTSQTRKSHIIIVRSYNTDAEVIVTGTVVSEVFLRVFVG